MNYSESFTQMHLLPVQVQNTLDKQDPHNPKFVNTHTNQYAILELKGIFRLFCYLLTFNIFFSYFWTQRESITEY